MANGLLEEIYSDGFKAGVAHALKLLAEASGKPKGLSRMARQAWRRMLASQRKPGRPETFAGSTSKGRR